jgi:hypothetical protein
MAITKRTKLGSMEMFAPASEPIRQPGALAAVVVIAQDYADPPTTTCRPRAADLVDTVPGGVDRLGASADGRPGR